MVDAKALLALVKRTHGAGKVVLPAGLDVTTFLRVLSHTKHRPLAHQLNRWALQNAKMFDHRTAGMAAEQFIRIWQFDRFDARWQLGVHFASDVAYNISHTPHHRLGTANWDDMSRTLLSLVTLLTSHGRENDAIAVFTHITKVHSRVIGKVNVLGLNALLSASACLEHKHISDGFLHASVQRLLFLARNAHIIVDPFQTFKPKWVYRLFVNLSTWICHLPASGEYRHGEGIADLMRIILAKHSRGMKVAWLVKIMTTFRQNDLIYGIDQALIGPVVGALEDNIRYLPETAENVMVLMGTLHGLKVPENAELWDLCAAAVLEEGVEEVMAALTSASIPKGSLIEKLIKVGEGGLPRPVVMVALQGYSALSGELQLRLLASVEKVLLQCSEEGRPHVYFVWKKNLPKNKWKT